MMLIRNGEFKTSACCVLILTIIVANGAAGAALERQFDDRSTNGKHEDWRQPLPTVSISVIRRCALTVHNLSCKDHQKVQTSNVKNARGSSFVVLARSYSLSFRKPLNIRVPFSAPQLELTVIQIRIFHFCKGVERGLDASKRESQ